MNSKSGWKAFLEFMHTVGVAGIVPRKELVQELPMLRPHTIDYYRRMMELLGYMSRYSVGQYVKKKYIPLDLNLTELKRKLGYVS